MGHGPGSSTPLPFSLEEADYRKQVGEIGWKGCRKVYKIKSGCLT